MQVVACFLSFYSTIQCSAVQYSGKAWRVRVLGRTRLRYTKSSASKTTMYEYPPCLSDADTVPTPPNYQAATASSTPRPPETCGKTECTFPLQYTTIPILSISTQVPIRTAGLESPWETTGCASWQLNVVYVEGNLLERQTQSESTPGSTVVHRSYGESETWTKQKIVVLFLHQGRTIDAGHHFKTAIFWIHCHHTTPAVILTPYNATLVALRTDSVKQLKHARRTTFWRYSIDSVGRVVSLSDLP